MHVIILDLSISRYISILKINGGQPQHIYYKLTKEDEQENIKHPMRKILISEKPILNYKKVFDIIDEGVNVINNMLLIIYY